MLFSLLSSRQHTHNPMESKRTKKKVTISAIFNCSHKIKNRFHYENEIFLSRKLKWFRFRFNSIDELKCTNEEIICLFLSSSFGGTKHCFQNALQNATHKRLRCVQRNDKKSEIFTLLWRRLSHSNATISTWLRILSNR